MTADSEQMTVSQNKSQCGVVLSSVSDGLDEFVALSGIGVVLLQGKKGSGMGMFATVLTYKLKEMFDSNNISGSYNNNKIGRYFNE